MKTLRFFTLSAAGLLLASGLVHLLNAAGHTQTLALPDPLLGIPLRYGLLIAGALEVTVALICLLGKPGGLQFWWLAWMGTNLLVYRLGLIWSGCHLECTSIGYPTDPLHISRATAALVLNLTTIYPALGSYAALILSWKLFPRPSTLNSSPRHNEVTAGQPSTFRSQPSAPSSQPSTLNSQPPATTPSTLNYQPSTDKYYRLTCPHCGGHVAFPAQRLGQNIPCPHCSKELTLNPAARSQEPQPSQREN